MAHFNAYNHQHSYYLEYEQWFFTHNLGLAFQFFVTYYQIQWMYSNWEFVYSAHSRYIYMVACNACTYKQLWTLNISVKIEAPNICLPQYLVHIYMLFSRNLWCCVVVNHEVFYFYNSNLILKTKVIKKSCSFWSKALTLIARICLMKWIQLSMLFDGIMKNLIQLQCNPIQSIF